MLAFLVIRHQPHVDHEIRIIGPLAYPLAVAIFAVVASAPFSVTDALAIMNGAIFGPVEGTLVDTVGLVLRRVTRLLDQPPRVEALQPAGIAAPPSGVGEALSRRLAGLLAGRARHSGFRRNGCDRDRRHLSSADLGARLDDVRDRRSRFARC